MISKILLPVETTLLLSVAALYIVHCPFNKVEESFNTQAVHDILNLFPQRVPLKDPDIEDLTKIGSSELEIAVRSELKWDHQTFPGVVPRTFLGALMIGLPLKIAKYFMTQGFLGPDSIADEPDLTSQFILQIGARFALSSFVVLSLSSINQAIHKRYGLTYRLCFLIATINQFHYMFYAGRFLPNTFASILANLAFASWINRQYSKSIIYIALCVVIFRFDTSIFFGWLLLDGVFIRKLIPLNRVLKVGIPAGLIAIAITFIVDSFFWARPVWPELEGLYFNLWLNKSHEWGTQPYFWYIYSCLPRITLATGPLLLFADHKITRDYLIPVLVFIFTYSLLPHKELRFILFITPLINICVASGLSNLYYFLNKTLQSVQSILENLFKKASRNDQSGKKQTETRAKNSGIAMLIFSIILLSLFLTNMFACLVLSRISSHNYPGGQSAISLGMTKELLDSAQKSLDKNIDLQDPTSDVGVYVNNLAAQTGVSRFIQVNGVYYAKTPKLDENTFKRAYKFIYVILEPKEVLTYLGKFCPLERNQGKLFDKGLEKWRKDKSEMRCFLPNQAEMYCSIIDSVHSFRSINIGGLLVRLQNVITMKVSSETLNSDDFIRTKVALYILRCSTGSKFNPFS